MSAGNAPVFKYSCDGKSEVFSIRYLRYIQFTITVGEDGVRGREGGR